MKHFNTRARRLQSYFKVLASTRSSQAAIMLLKPGESSSDEVENEHPASEQWCYIISGTGRATVGRRKVRLGAGSLLLVEKGEGHEVTNTGRAPLLTLNFYAPPAYTMGGELRAGSGR